MRTETSSPSLYTQALMQAATRPHSLLRHGRKQITMALAAACGLSWSYTALVAFLALRGA